MKLVLLYHEVDMVVEKSVVRNLVVSAFIANFAVRI